MGGPATGPNPTDRGKPGSKHHVATERRGIPLAVGVSGANRPDHTVFEPLVERIPPIKRPRGRPRKRPDKLHADKGYDYRHCRAHLRRRGIKARIARKGVERTLAWLHRYRRLTIRYERDDRLHQAFLDLGCALICLNFLRGP